MNINTLLDAGALLNGFGPFVLIGLGIVVFIESGVLFPFLPGDSLLVTAAIVRHDLSIRVWMLLLVAAVAAVVGDQVGFWLGRRFGRGMFKDEARVLKTDYLRRAEAFFAKHGAFALVIGRFVPIVRTYIPVAAGTAAMSYRKFFGWNVLGALGWVVSMVLVGVLLGDIPGIADRIDMIMLVIVGLSVLPLVLSSIAKIRRDRAIIG